MEIFLQLIISMTLLSTFLHVGKATVILLVKPQNVTAFPSEEINLRCIFSSATPSECYWSQNNRYFIPDGQQFVFSGDTKQGDCSLRIPHTTLENDGFYRCGFMTVGSEPGIISEPPAKVTIIDAPEFPHIEYKGDIVTDGEIRVQKSDINILLKCIVREGNPEATIRWYSNNTEITGNTSVTNNKMPLTTTINEVNIAMSSQYHLNELFCKATHPSCNTTANAMVVSVIIIMEGPVTETNVLFINGTGIPYIIEPEVILICVAYAEPKPDLVWEIRKSIEWEAIGKIGNLEISPLADIGFYRCGAKNVYNNATAYVYSSEFQVTGEEDDGVNAGVIAGIAVTIIVLAVAVALLTCIVYKRRRNNSKSIVAKRNDTPNESHEMEPFQAKTEDKVLRHNV